MHHTIDHVDRGKVRRVPALFKEKMLPNPFASLRNNGYNFSTSDIEEALRRGLMIPDGVGL